MLHQGNRELEDGPAVVLHRQVSVIPTCIDQNLRAHFRRPMVMMRHG